MAKFVKINFDADSVDDGASSAGSANEFSDDFFMDDSSGDSFVMVDDVDFVDESLAISLNADDSNSKELNDYLSIDSSDEKHTLDDSSDIEESSVDVAPLFKKRGIFAAGGDSVSSETRVESDTVDKPSLTDDSLSDSIMAENDETSVVESVGDTVDSLSDDELSDSVVNPLLFDEDDEGVSGGLDFSDSLLGSSSVVEGDTGVGSFDSSVGLDVPVVNPLLVEDDEDAPFLGFDELSNGSSVVEKGSLDKADFVSSGGVDDAREVVRSLADESVSVEEFSVPVDSDSAVEDGSSVVVHKRGPRFIESEFRRQNVSEVVVDSEAVEEKPEKKRYRYVRDDGRLNGAELDFFKRLGVSRRDREADDERLRVLRGRVDGVDTVAARKARNVLYGQAIGADDMLRRGSKLRFSEMDRDVLQFLAKFRYVKDEHLAIAFNRAPSTMYSRLKKLRSQGLVLDKKVYGSRPIWFLTEAGMLLSGFDVARVTEGKMSTMMFPHQFTVNHVAANVWGANVNVLNLDDFPLRNRVDAKGVPIFGERLIGEVEIQSSFGRMKMFDKAEVFVPELKANVDRAFEKWEKAGGVKFGESPEFQMGNEYMWALLPPASLRKAYHIPDLVVMRPRNEDGSPESIAVEVEINNKDTESYEKVLRAYRADDKIFKKVVWVCKSVGPARKLENVAKNIGLWQDGRIEILPVITEHGIFKERDMWFI